MLKHFRKCLNNITIAKKCCFCVSVRKGVLIFGYVNLVLSLLSFPLLLLMYLYVDGAMLPPYGPEPWFQLPITITFLIVDLGLTIMLLIGTHKKHERLLAAYLYFGIGFQLLTLCVDLVYLDYREYVETSVYFVFLGLNIYLLFLVYSLLKILEQSSEVQYVSYQEHQRAL